MMSSFIYPTATDLNLPGKTLIVPIVSTGNVSQLAADILITSLSLHRLAILEPKYCIPVIGGREGGDSGVIAPLELYGGENVDLLVVQQRSPVLKSRKGDFVSALFDFIQSSQFGSVLFLSSVDSSNRVDSQMMTPTYQIRPPNSPPLAFTPLSSLTTLPIPAYTYQICHTPSTGESPTIPFIPGGGLTRRLLNSLPIKWSIPTASLIQFAMEGDNQGDAGLLAVVTARVLGYELADWKQPMSWREGLFGTPHDQTLYG